MTGHTGLTDFGDKKTVKSSTGDKNANFNHYDFHHYEHQTAKKGCGREARPTDVLYVLAVALKPFFLAVNCVVGFCRSCNRHSFDGYMQLLPNPSNSLLERVDWDSSNSAQLAVHAWSRAFSVTLLGGLPHGLPSVSEWSPASIAVRSPARVDSHVVLRALRFAAQFCCVRECPQWVSVRRSAPSAVPVFGKRRGCPQEPAKGARRGCSPRVPAGGARQGCLGVPPCCSSSHGDGQPSLLGSAWVTNKRLARRCNNTGQVSPRRHV